MLPFIHSLQQFAEMERWPVIEYVSRKKKRDSINSINSAFQLFTASEAPGAPLGVPYKLLAII